MRPAHSDELGMALRSCGAVVAGGQLGSSYGLDWAGITGSRLPPIGMTTGSAVLPSWTAELAEMHWSFM